MKLITQSITFHERDSEDLDYEFNILMELLFLLFFLHLGRGLPLSMLLYESMVMKTQVLCYLLVVNTSLDS